MTLQDAYKNYETALQKGLLTEFKTFIKNAFNVVVPSYDEAVKYWAIWDYQQSKLDIAIEALEKAKIKECYCHVGASDGYQGTNHSDKCIFIFEVLEKIK